MSDRASLSGAENAAVGCVGGVVETTVLMPVLTWKICLQEGRPYPRFPHMYRGLVVQAGSLAPITGVQMVVNGLLENLAGGGERSLSDFEVGDLF